MKMYIVEQGGNLLAVTDNFDKVQELQSQNFDVTVTEAPCCSFEDLVAFDIYENDAEKNYGYSTVYYKYDDGLWDITMYQTRFKSVTREEGISFLEYTDIFCDEAKAYWNESETIEGILACHCDFWCFKETPAAHTVDVFLLTDTQIDCLLKTGFEAERVFIYA